MLFCFTLPFPVPAASTAASPVTPAPDSLKPASPLGGRCGFFRSSLALTILESRGSARFGQLLGRLREEEAREARGRR